MRYEDVISIDTPEGVPLELTLAGVGSRFLAAIVDSAIQFATILLIVVIVSALGASGTVTAGGVVLSFLVFFGYDILFEVKSSGRTPGKRLTGLRVVRRGGGPVGFRTSAVRNLLRLVDLLPGMYFVGIISVLATKQNQRLGDLAAGTLVLREIKATVPIAPVAVATPELQDEVATWDVSGVTADELATVRRFLERRPGLAPAARTQLAEELTRRLYPKVVGPPPEVAAEHFLEQLVAAKAGRSL
ncbi:MAG: RDD family protein [Actinobacteria bacterium]|nr:RDD family protein [Actinomycetota bacterium]MBV9935532.1 RDD family protein [Actinomycetota bacterium]